MPLIWLIAMVLLLIVEAVVPGLISIWFALGALAALLASMLHGSGSRSYGSSWFLWQRFASQGPLPRSM